MNKEDLSPTAREILGPGGAYELEKVDIAQWTTHLRTARMLIGYGKLLRPGCIRSGSNVHPSSDVRLRLLLICIAA